MAGGGETRTVTTTSDQTPWSGQQPYLTAGFQRAQDIFNRPTPQYYGGQTVTDTPAATVQGQQQTMQAAQNNANLLGATAGGQFLSSGNPYFGGLVEQIGQAIRPNIDSTFAASGRYGSGAHANAYASALANQAGQLAFQNYNQERQNQIAAAQNYSPYQQMMNVGSQQEAKQGQYLADALARYDFAQNADYNQLAQFMQMVGNRSYGGQTSQTQPYTSNPVSTYAGAATGLLGGLGALTQGLGGLGLKLWG